MSHGGGAGGTGHHGHHGGHGNLFGLMAVLFARTRIGHLILLLIIVCLFK